MISVGDILEKFLFELATEETLLKAESAIKENLDGNFFVKCTAIERGLNARFEFDSKEDEIIFILRYGNGCN